jgi:hypothetical protein
MRPLPPDLLEHLQRRDRPRDPALEARAGGLHLWGTIGTDLLLTPAGALIGHRWDLSRGDGESQGALAEVTDPRLRGRYLRAVAATVPELAAYAQGEQPVDCIKCLQLLQRGFLVDSCEDCSDL